MELEGLQRVRHEERVNCGRETSCAARETDRLAAARLDCARSLTAPGTAIRLTGSPCRSGIGSSGPYPVEPSDPGQRVTTTGVTREADASVSQAHFVSPVAEDGVAVSVTEDTQFDRKRRNPGSRPSGGRFEGRQLLALR